HRDPQRRGSDVRARDQQAGHGDQDHVRPQRQDGSRDRDVRDAARQALMADGPDITALLVRARAGEGRDQLFDAVYRGLENVAKAAVRGGASLEPRGLVHELYLRLTQSPLEARDRKHFYAIAALAMRQILVDRARKRQSAKRGGPSKEQV